MNINEQKKQEIQKLAKDFARKIQICNAVMDVDYPGTGDMIIDALVKELNKLRKQPEQGCSFDTEGERTKVVFKRITEFPKPCFDFGGAIEAVKDGKRVARMGWNGKDQYVVLAKGISYVTTLGTICNVEHRDIGNECLAFVGTSGVQMGWLASQADMLAEDWYIVE